MQPNGELIDTALEFLHTVKSDELSPECQLVLAVLQDGLLTFLGRPVVSSNHTKTDKARLVEEATQWVFSDDESWLFAFKNCCAALGIDPDYLRHKCREYKSQIETNGKEFLTTKDLASYLGVHWSSVYSWRRRGQLPPPCINGLNLRWSRADIDRWLQSLNFKPWRSASSVGGSDKTAGARLRIRAM